MKIFAILSIARQVNGEYCVAKAEKAFIDEAKAREYAGALSKRYAETIPTPGGPMACICERGIFEFEVEE